MTYTWLIPLFAAVITLAVAILVNRTDPQIEVGRAFTFLAVLLVFWNLNFFILYSVTSHELALSLTRIVRIGGLFAPPAVLHLALSLRPQRSRVWRYALATDYMVSTVIALLNAFDLLVSDVHPFAWGYSSVGTPLYNLLTVSVVANFGATAGILCYDYRTSAEPRLRLQLKFWLLGALAGLPLALTNLLPAYGIRFYPLGNLGEAAFVCIVAYAIARHRLMDIDLVVTKGMAYAAVLFVLVAPAFGLTMYLQRLSFGHIHPDFSFLLFVLFIAVAVLFPSLRFRAETKIHRSLFREKYEYREALSAFSRSIVRILDRERLLQQLGTALRENLGLDRIAVALIDESKQRFALQFSLGPISTTQIPRDHPFIHVLARCQDAALVDELEAASAPAERTAVVEACRANGWQACIPLATGGTLIGFISLGRKDNRDPFFAEDLELLSTLAAETSIALENARLYEELKRSQDIIRRTDRLSALGTLAAGIAHEVRNPLVSIQTFFQLAPDRLHDEEFFTTFLGMTANEVKRISDLITELLSFARTPTRSLGSVSLNEAVDGVVKLLEPEARKHKLSLVWMPNQLLPLVHADADQIKQVLINLILNGIQATPPGGSVSIRSRPVRHRDTAYAQLEIKDTGRGIPKEQLDDIFNPFFTTKDKGTGLGLSIANQIITEHGGFISVESEKDHGATFLINLPAIEDDLSTKESNIGDEYSILFVPERKIASR